MPDWIGTFQKGLVMTAQNGVNTALTRPGRVFPRPFTDGGICPPPYGVFKNKLYNRHDFNVECRRGYKYENSQHLEISQIYVNGKCPYPRAKMNGKCPTPWAQKTGKSPTLSREGPSGIHLILLLPDVEGPAGFLSLFLSSS